MLKMGESNIADELEKIGTAYSMDKIAIIINEESVHFECMDERKN